MKIFGRNASAPLMLLIVCSVLAGGVLAAFIVSRPISTTMTIQAFEDIEVFDVDGVTPLTDWAFGEINRGYSRTIPDPTYVDTFSVMNTGETTLYVGYSTVDWPADVTLIVRLSNEGPFIDLTEGVFTEELLGGESREMAWYIEVGPSALWGYYEPTITIEAHDAPT